MGWLAPTSKRPAEYDLALRLFVGAVEVMKFHHRAYVLQPLHHLDPI